MMSESITIESQNGKPLDERLSIDMLPTDSLPKVNTTEPEHPQANWHFKVGSTVIYTGDVIAASERPATYRGAPLHEQECTGTSMTVTVELTKMNLVLEDLSDGLIVSPLLTEDQLYKHMPRNFLTSDIQKDSDEIGSKFIIRDPFNLRD